MQICACTGVRSWMTPRRWSDQTANNLPLTLTFAVVYALPLFGVLSNWRNTRQVCYTNFKSFFFFFLSSFFSFFALGILVPVGN